VLVRAAGAWCWVSCSLSSPATTLATKDQGFAYNISPHDLPPPPVTTLTRRFQRAFGNFRETFVYFAVAELIVRLMNKSNATTALGAIA
jgi:uncharacterized MAPEG superfamily protein